MALIPYILDDLFESPVCHYNDWWPVSRRNCSNPAGYLRRLNSTLGQLDGIEKKTHIGKDGFQVCLDVQQFQPNEISVKTVDNTIEIEAKHEERRDDHGYISRQFKRRYELPSGFRAQDVVSTISSDGVLTVKAPPATPAVEGNVRHVQIQHTGPAHLSVENKKEENGKEKK